MLLTNNFVKNVHSSSQNNSQQIIQRQRLLNCNINVIFVCGFFSRSSHTELFLGKGLYNFTEIALRHGYSPVNLMHIFGTPLPKNTSEWLFLFLQLNCCDFRSRKGLIFNEVSVSESKRNNIMNDDLVFIFIALITIIIFVFIKQKNFSLRHI